MTQEGIAESGLPKMIGHYLGAPAPSAPVSVAIGTAAAALSILLRLAATPYIGDGEALLTAFPLVLVASLVADRWGGWTCLVLCTIASWYIFIGDAFTFSFGRYEKGILIGTFLAGAFVIQISVLLRRTFAEIADLRASERLLSRELEHRIKNTLTLVLSIARQTFRDERPLPSARADFEGRMFALGAAQSITGSRAEPAPIVAIVERSLVPFCGDAVRERLATAGPDIAVDNVTTVALSLIFHELATNAAKYGALSSEGGRIDVSWSCDATNRLTLRWTERGGPPLAAPTREGFGTTLINRLIVRNLKGSISIAYPPSGLEATLSAPIKG